MSMEKGLYQIMSARINIGFTLEKYYEVQENEKGSDGYRFQNKRPYGCC